MFDTVGEIKEAITEKEGLLTDLWQRCEDDFGLYTLEKYAAEAGYESYTSSAPRNFFDKVTDGINAAEMSLQIKLPENASEEDRRRASLGEMFLFGGLAAVDRRFRSIGEPTLREQMAFFMDLRGWVALRALVYQQKDQTIFDAMLWDILHTTWEMGSKNILWAANKRKCTRSQIYSEYGVEIKGKDGMLIDWWDSVGNAVIVDDDFVKPPKAHGLAHPPIFIASVGSMPTILTRENESTLKHRGDSVWTASRDLYKPFNKIASRTLDIYERSVSGSLVHKSKMGDKSIEGDPYKTFQEIKLAEDESLTPLETPKAPPETAIIHSIINTDIEQSTLPYPLAYGGTRQAMSGAALGMLQEATRSIYNPRTGLIESAYTWLCEEFLSQYSTKGSKADLKGYKANGEFFVVKVKPKEIDPEWFISVKCEPRLPRDKEAEIMMSLAATRQTNPGDIALLSKQTAREDILQLRDPDAEEDKVLEEMGQALPPIMATKIAAALKERGKDDLAQDVLALLNPQAAQRANQPPTELLMAAAEALASTGDPKMQQLAAALAQFVKKPPQSSQTPQQGTAQAPQQGAAQAPEQEIGSPMGQPTTNQPLV